MYKISASVKALNGRIRVADFFLGDDPDFASDIFNRFSGNRDEEDPFIRLDLVRREPGRLDMLLDRLACTLDQYTANCRIITREVFKRHVLENSAK